MALHVVKALMFGVGVYSCAQSTTSDMGGTGKMEDFVAAVCDAVSR